MTLEVRCPTDDKLLMGLSEDFDGAVSTKCRHCKADVAFPIGAFPPSVRLRCLCRTWLATGVVVRGECRLQCRHCRVLVGIQATGVHHLEPPRVPVRRPSTVELRPDPSERIVALVEERWQLLRMDRAHRSVDLAVGIRFDVLSRDDFRCVYCGRGPAQGVLLEVDHVIPRSAGGPDTMANLVSACWDCNRGKAAKRLSAIAITA